MRFLVSILTAKGKIEEKFASHYRFKCKLHKKTFSDTTKSSNAPNWSNREVLQGQGSNLDSAFEFFLCCKNTVFCCSLSICQSFCSITVIISCSISAPGSNYSTHPTCVFFYLNLSCSLIWCYCCVDVVCLSDLFLCPDSGDLACCHDLAFFTLDLDFGQRTCIAILGPKFYILTYVSRLPLSVINS